MNVPGVARILYNNNIIILASDVRAFDRKIRDILSIVGRKKENKNQPDIVRLIYDNIT